MKLRQLCLVAVIFTVYGCDLDHTIINEGYIIYKYPAALAGKGNERTDTVYKTYYEKVYFKNGKTRIEPLPPSGNAELNNGKEQITLINDTTPGFEFIRDTLFPTKPKGKYYTRCVLGPAGTNENIFKALIHVSAIYTDEKKIIAGYECKKVIFPAMNNIGYTYEEWYSDKISPLAFTGQGDMGLKGLILESDIVDGGKKNISSIAMVVFSEPVPDSLFVIPKEYRERSANEDIQSGK